VSKLKIAYFIDAYHPGAGTENQLKGILQNLNPDKVDACVYTLRDPIPEEHRREIPWPVECLGVGALKHPASLLKFFKLVGRLRREKYDIVNIYFVDTNLFVAPACRLAGIKNCVINRRDMGYWYTPTILSWLNRVNRMADYFLTNSRAVKQAVVENEVFPAERIKVIYNGMWGKPRRPAEKVTREKLGLRPEGQLVGIVANLRSVKRIDRFVEMAAGVKKAVPGTQFLIIGHGELEADLRRQAEELAVGGDVHFLGHVANVADYLELLDIGVLTSESEGLSNALIEYAQAGLPIVTFDVGGNREIVHPEVNGLLAADGDVAGLTAGVVRILTDPGLSDRFSAAGRELVGRLFDPRAVLDETMAFYDAVARTERRTARFD
jgi:glycosyltransferase involved in cell wall biosynthesis